MQFRSDRVDAPEDRPAQPEALNTGYIGVFRTPQAADSARFGVQRHPNPHATSHNLLITSKFIDDSESFETVSQDRQRPAAVAPDPSRSRMLRQRHGPTHCARTGRRTALTRAVIERSRQRSPKTRQSGERVRGCADDRTTRRSSSVPCLPNGLPFRQYRPESPDEGDV